MIKPCTIIIDVFKKINTERKMQAKVSEFITLEEFFYYACENEEVEQILKEVGVKDINIIQSTLKHYLDKLVKIDNDAKIKTPKTESLEYIMKNTVASALNLNERKTPSFLDLLTTVMVVKSDDQSEKEKCAIVRTTLERSGVTLDKISEYKIVNSSEESKKKIGITTPEPATNNQNNNEDDININQFIKDMTLLSKEENYSPVIGRTSELDEIIQILLKKKKSAALLLGEAGVGKTAIVEGLAIKMANKEISVLKDYKLYSLDVPSIVSGTKYRGDFEKRFNAILNKVTKDNNIVLFIDEIHLVIGSGSTSVGNIDGANILKPWLSSGKVKLIGATTNDEKRSILDKDVAFMRRFQCINVNEPTKDECEEIITRSLPIYEKHHGVKYEAGLVRQAINLADRYLSNKKMPDKIFDIIDSTGSIAKINGHKKVTMKDVGLVISKMANIPEVNLSKSEKEKLIYLEEKLNTEIFGQKEAVESLVNEIIIAKSNIGDNGKRKPIASFMFSGPTGVGKTELTNVLGKELDMNIIRFDMSEYMEKHAISKLIGAPAGYVGYEGGGELTKEVSKNPYSIILLDEIEKAHSDIYNILLQILDNGSLRDNKGNNVDFKNTIIILTTNAGTKAGMVGSIGFYTDEQSLNETRREKIKESLEKTFKPEIRNRLDHIIYFNGLTMEMAKEITNKKLSFIVNDFKEQDINVEFSDLLINFIAQNVYENEQNMGARPIDRKIKEFVTKSLAKKIIMGEIKKGENLIISIHNGEITLNKKEDTKKNKKNEKLKEEELI